MPVLYVSNVDEGSAATGNDYARAVEKRAAEEGLEPERFGPSVDFAAATTLQRRRPRARPAALPGFHGLRYGT